MSPHAPRITVVHPYAWLWELLEGEPTFILRTMFGTKAAYVGGRLALCFSAKAEPWFGVLVCTDHGHHDSLRRDFPTLVPHPILPKWLYLSDTTEGFDVVAERLVRLVQRRDPRIGVEPGSSREKRKPASPPKRARPRRSPE